MTEWHSADVPSDVSRVTPSLLSVYILKLRHWARATHCILSTDHFFRLPFLPWPIPERDTARQRVPLSSLFHRNPIADRSVRCFRFTRSVRRSTYLHLRAKNRTRYFSRFESPSLALKSELRRLRWHFDPSSLDARYRTRADSIEKIQRRFLRFYVRVSTKSVSSFRRLRSVLKQLHRQKFRSFSSLTLHPGLSGSFHYSTHLRTGLTMPLIAASIVSANMPIYSTRNCSSRLRNMLETSYLRNTFLFPYRV